ncbi:hypothetical protein X798_05018, partial [Onchocerca flexuosa]
MENIKSIQTLTPMMALHSLFLAIYLGALFVYFAFGFTFSVGSAPFLESSFSLLPSITCIREQKTWIK